MQKMNTIISFLMIETMKKMNNLYFTLKNHLIKKRLQKTLKIFKSRGAMIWWKNNAIRRRLPLYALLDLQTPLLHRPLQLRSIVIAFAQDGRKLLFNALLAKSHGWWNLRIESWWIWMIFRIWCYWEKVWNAKTLLLYQVLKGITVLAVYSYMQLLLDHFGGRDTRVKPSNIILLYTRDRQFAYRFPALACPAIEPTNPPCFFFLLNVNFLGFSSVNIRIV